jgi:2-oxoglutarate/2-oxoacid ferredoxin oxidoreductase subunit alpha
VIPKTVGEAIATPENGAFEELESVVIRFAGDSGDGMQVTGTQFTNTSAVLGNDVSTMPDFPAEIRAPAGTLAGVSGFQVNISSHDIYTPGDAPQVLVAMNPAALCANIDDLEPGGTIIANTDEFTPNNLRRANYEANPLEDGSLRGYRVIAVPISTLNRNALADIEGLSNKDKDRCKNFFSLGLTFWMYDRQLDTTLQWLAEKYAKRPAIVEANTRALKVGYHYGETAEAFRTRYRVPKAVLPSGVYRKITGNEATALGFVTASVLAKRPLFYGSYPITPASDILHELARFKNFPVRTFQAEDEIAAIGAAIGAAYGGSLGLTGTSGPGVALKSEAIGLAVMTELPMVIIDVQRGGPSTGLPTKTEQADLFQAVFGRNSECPVAVLAPATPSECFTMALEAFRIAIKYMTPVMFLSDGYLGNGAEPWKIPAMHELPDIPVKFHTDRESFQPYRRDPRTLARLWAIPGTPGLEHRIGGLEKEDVTGNVSYDPQNHEKMVHLRAQKIAGIAADIPEVKVMGPDKGRLLVLGWGSTHGCITSAVEKAQAKGASVASAHLRYLNPFPRNLGEILRRYEKVLVPELNLGQLRFMIRGHYLVDAAGLNKVQGKPFKISEILGKIEEML